MGQFINREITKWRFAEGIKEYANLDGDYTCPAPKILVDDIEGEVYRLMPEWGNNLVYEVISIDSYLERRYGR